MTLFGLIWVVLLICCFRDVKKLLTLTIISATIQCSNVFEFAGTGIGPQVITSFLFILRIMLNKSGLIINKKSKGKDICLLMLLLLAVIVISNIINGRVISTMFKLLQLVIYMVCFCCMLKEGKNIDGEYLYKLIRRLSIFLLIVGFIQIGITSGVLPRFGIVKTLLYNDTTNEFIYYNQLNYKRVLSTFMEPSYYAGYIVGAFYYLLSIKDKRKENYILLAFMLLQIILTFSSSAYGAFFIVGIIFIVSPRETKFKLNIILLGLVGFFLMYLFFYDILDTVIFSKGLSESANTRNWWNRDAITMFKISPIIGNGYKSSRASQIIYTMLAEFGVVGLISYILLNLRFFLYYVSKKYRSKFGYSRIPVLMGMLSVIATQIIGVPDIDICTYWMWANIVALGMTATSKEKVNENISGFNTIIISHHRYREIRTMHHGRNAKKR